MEFASEEIGEGVTRVTLSGRMDIAGAGKVDLPFQTVCGSREQVVVDMSGVSFLSSMGIRTLLMGAKNLSSRRGQIVLVGPSAQIVAVLKATGVDGLLPTAPDLPTALDQLRPTGA